MHCATVIYLTIRGSFRFFEGHNVKDCFILWISSLINRMQAKLTTQPARNEAKMGVSVLPAISCLVSHVVATYYAPSLANSCNSI